MKLIAENLHIISKKTKEAILNKDIIYIKNLIQSMSNENPDWIDLNIGPARANFAGTMKWLIEIVNDITTIPISFDTTNIDEIEQGLLLTESNKTKCLINSTNADADRLEKVMAVAAKYNTNVITLTMNSEFGIPKDADKRLELAMEIADYASEKGMENQQLFFDPLVLPVCVDQSQASECLNTLRMLKESFDPQVNTTIGLSNVSNGCPKELRPMINQVFMVLAMGCGLDTAIVDIFDKELLRINKMISNAASENSKDEMMLKLYHAMQNFEEIEDISFDKNNIELLKIYKTAEILLNKKIYSHSYLEI